MVLHDDRGGDWSDAFTSRGLPGWLATTRQGRSLLYSFQGEHGPADGFHMLASSTVGESTSVVLSHLACGALYDSPQTLIYIPLPSPASFLKPRSTSSSSNTLFHSSDHADLPCLPSLLSSYPGSLAQLCMKSACNSTKFYDCPQIVSRFVFTKVQASCVC